MPASPGQAVSTQASQHRSVIRSTGPGAGDADGLEDPAEHDLPDTIDDLPDLAGRTGGPGNAGVTAHERDIPGGVILDVFEVPGQSGREPVSGCAGPSRVQERGQVPGRAVQRRQIQRLLAAEIVVDECP